MAGPCNSYLMSTMAVEIYAGAVQIGTVDLAAWDYGMGVAGGDFQPSSAYSASEYAALGDTGRLDQLTTPLEARTVDGKRIACDLVAVTDYAASVGSEGCEVALYGVDLVFHFGPEPLA